MSKLSKSSRVFRLCYVDGHVLYFTDNFSGQWGDDWDDAPYEHNAGEPYELVDGEDDQGRANCGHIRFLAFKPTYEVRLPCTGHLNSPFSVERINRGAVAWLYCDEAGGLAAGATMDEAAEWLRAAGLKWGELK